MTKITIKSVTEQFNQERAKGDDVSDFVTLMRITKGSQIPLGVLREAFDKLVDKGDFLSQEKKDLVAHLYELSKPDFKEMPQAEYNEKLQALN